MSKDDKIVLGMLMSSPKVINLEYFARKSKIQLMRELVYDEIETYQNCADDTKNQNENTQSKICMHYVTLPFVQ